MTPPCPRARLGLSVSRRSTTRHIRLATCALLVLLAVARAAAGAPDGQMTWGVHISLAPTWFDPAETQGIITPFMVMYALHDALAKAMPGNPPTATAPGWRSPAWASSPATPTRRPTKT